MLGLGGEPVVLDLGHVGTQSKAWARGEAELASALDPGHVGRISGLQATRIDGWDGNLWVVDCGSWQSRPPDHIRGVGLVH